MHRVTELDAKEDNDALIDGDYIVDEKARTATLTADGVAKAEKAFGVENLMDAENMTLLHHINQAIRANGLMKRDVDYVVKDDEIDPSVTLSGMDLLTPVDNTFLSLWSEAPGVAVPRLGRSRFPGIFQQCSPAGMEYLIQIGADTDVRVGGYQLQRTVPGSIEPPGLNGLGDHFGSPFSEQFDSLIL